MKERTINLTDGDVDRITIEQHDCETRLLIFTSEDEPLTQARLTRNERFELAMALTSTPQRLPLVTRQYTIEALTALDDSAYEKALAAWNDIRADELIENYLLMIIRTREALEGFCVKFSHKERTEV